MKLELNQENKMDQKNNKLKSLFIVLFLTVFSIFIVGTVIFGVTGNFLNKTAASVLGAQLGILFLFLSLFSFNIDEIKNLFTPKITIKQIVVIPTVVLGIFVFNVFLSLALNTLGITNPEGYTSNAMQAKASGSILASVVLPTLVAPILEELAFRAGFKRILVDKSTWKPYQYVIISSAIFALLHTQISAFSWSTFLLIAFIAVINSVIYLKTKNILIPILIHLLYNATVLWIVTVVLA